MNVIGCYYNTKTLTFLNLTRMRIFVFKEKLNFRKNGNEFLILLTHFARMQASFLINIEKILSGPITKFYNDDNVNMIAADLRPIKTRPTSFYKKHNLL